MTAASCKTVCKNGNLPFFFVRFNPLVSSHHNKTLHVALCDINGLTASISNFNQTHEGFMLEQQHTMDTRHVDSLGLFATGEPGDFRIELDGIIACRRSEMWNHLKKGEQQSPHANGSGALH